MNYKSGDIMIWIDYKFKAIAIDYVLNCNINNNGLLYLIAIENLDLIDDEQSSYSLSQIINMNNGLTTNFKIFHWED